MDYRRIRATVHLALIERITVGSHLPAGTRRLLAARRPQRRSLRRSLRLRPRLLRHAAARARQKGKFEFEKAREIHVTGRRAPVDSHAGRHLRHVGRPAVREPGGGEREPRRSACFSPQHWEAVLFMELYTCVLWTLEQNREKRKL